MKTQLFHVLIFSFFFNFFNAQDLIVGKVTNEDDNELRSVLVFNLSNDQKAYTDQDGNFRIIASKGDELRFVKEHYERESLTINNNTYLSFYTIKLEAIPEEIEEVEIKYKPTGDLEKDAKHFEGSKKVENLNQNVNAYIAKKSSPSVLQRKPGEFDQNAFKPKQQGLDVIAAIAYGVSLLSKKKPILNSKEKSNFQKLVKSKMDTQYFINRGYTEEDIDRLIAYACSRFNLEQKFVYNFNIKAIEKHLKKAMTNFSTAAELEILDKNK